MSAHNDDDVDPRDRDVVEVDARKGKSDKPRSRRISWRKVIAHEVVVNRLGDVDATQLIVGPSGFVTDNAQPVGSSISADIEEMRDSMCLKYTENLTAGFLIRLGASRAKRGTRSSGYAFELFDRHIGEVDELFLQNAHRSVTSAVNHLRAGKYGFQNNSDERFVDDGGRTTALRDQNSTHF